MADNPRYIVRITSRWCIGAYVMKVRPRSPYNPIDFTDRIHKAKRFASTEDANKAMSTVPSPLCSQVPVATTYELIEVDGTLFCATHAHGRP